jgi:hypothetical protein
MAKRKDTQRPHGARESDHSASPTEVAHNGPDRAGEDTLPPSLMAPAAALTARFAGRHSPDVVRRCLTEAHDALAASARVPDFLPIFAERIVRDRLEREAPTQDDGVASGAPVQVPT